MMERVRRERETAADDGASEERERQQHMMERMKKERETAAYDGAREERERDCSI